jgi:addiction module HigA family antidote
MSGNPLLAGLGPVHPGEILREEFLPATDMNKVDIARRLGVSRQTLYDLIDERQPVTTAMALRLNRLFGNSPEFWLNLQRAYDLGKTEAEMADELAKIEPIWPDVDQGRA